MNISVVPEEICSAFYAPVYHHSMFCAGGGQDRKDSCNVRDGGGEEREGGNGEGREGHAGRNPPRETEGWRNRVIDMSSRTHRDTPQGETEIDSEMKRKEK